MWDYLLPGDYRDWPEPPMVHDWLGRLRPLKITNDIEVWVGEMCRARTLMDLDSVIEMLEKRSSTTDKA